MLEHDASPDHDRHMRRCIELARRALATADAPVGAVIVIGDRIVAEGVERVKARRDVTAHAEIEALRAACVALGSTDLTGATLYTSVDPCMMCAYAIRLARVGTVVSGTPPMGAATPLDGWTVLAGADAVPNRPMPRVVRGVLAEECRALLMAWRSPRGVGHD